MSKFSVGQSVKTTINPCYCKVVFINEDDPERPIYLLETKKVKDGIKGFWTTGYKSNPKKGYLFLTDSVLEPCIDTTNSIPASELGI